MYVLFQELCLHHYLPPFLILYTIVYAHNVIRNSHRTYDHEYPGFFYFIEVVDEKFKTFVLWNSNGTYIYFYVQPY